jgi:hypothetical protein
MQSRIRDKHTLTASVQETVALVVVQVEKCAGVAGIQDSLWEEAF